MSDNKVHRNRIGSNSLYRRTTQIAAYLVAETGDARVQFDATEKVIWTPEWEMLVRNQRPRDRVSVWDLLNGGSGFRMVAASPGTYDMALQDIPVLIRLGDLMKLLEKGGR